MEAEFNEKLKVWKNDQTNNFLLSSAEYEDLWRKLTVLNADEKKTKTTKEYRLLKRYAPVNIAGIKRLKKFGTDEYFIPMEEIFAVIKEAHDQGHGGYKRTLAKLKTYCNISRKMVEFYVGICEACQQKKSQKKKLVVKPVRSKDFLSRGQVDLIDWRTERDGEYNWILNYQDHFTKFVILKPLKTKRAEEVAFALLDIFLTFGAPNILQSDNGREFVNHVIEELAAMWPGNLRTNYFSYYRSKLLWQK